MNFSVETLAEYIVERGSSVYAATLDLTKAFDSVNHSKLYNTLMTAGIPLPIIDIIRCWYSKLFLCGSLEQSVVGFFSRFLWRSTGQFNVALPVCMLIDIGS